MTPDEHQTELSSSFTLGTHLVKNRSMVSTRDGWFLVFAWTVGSRSGVFFFSVKLKTLLFQVYWIVSKIKACHFWGLVKFSWPMIPDLTFTRTSCSGFRLGLVPTYSWGQFQHWFLSCFHFSFGFWCSTKFSKESHGVPINSLNFPIGSSTCSL
jgi:hypothetical protein